MVGSFEQFAILKPAHEQAAHHIMIGIGTIAGVAAGVATYMYAKKRRKDNKTAAIAGGVTGTGTAVIVSLAWPLLIVGIPVAWWLSTKNKSQKALPPGR